MLAVVVVHYGDPGPTLRCLAAIAADPSRVDRELVLVDNSATFSRAPSPDMALVSCPGNPGFGAGANRGVAALTGEPPAGVVVLNHDVEIEPGFLTAALNAVGQPGVGAAAGPLYTLPGRRLWYAGGAVNWFTGTVRQQRTPEGAVRERPVGFLPGAAMVIADAAWRECGGFDPRYFLYHEDLDLCLRLRRKGYSLMFTPGMAAIHHLGSATGSGRASPLYLEHLTATRLRPFRPLVYRLYLALLHSGWVAARASWHLTAGGGRLAAGALLRGHRRALAGVLDGPR